MIQRDSCWYSVHPFAVVSFLLSTFILAFLWVNPLFLSLIFISLLMWLGFEKKLGQVFRTFWFILPIMLFYMLINPLLQSNGEHFLWMGPVLPAIGRLDLSVEELLYSSMGVLRLSIIMLLSAGFLFFVDQERFLFFFARITPRFVISSVMAIRLFPFMMQESNRIQEVMSVRGIRPTGKGIRSWISFKMTMLKPLIYSTMEGSWITAESLYVRGFGSGPRSYYRTTKMQQQEKITLLMCGILVLFGVFGKLLRFGLFQFYQWIHWFDPVGDMMFVTMLLGFWGAILIWMRKGVSTGEHVSSE
ncbi:energy-coupling factor transporter transmembrane component T [Brevibacillus sp. SYSU BS000544]|uniref:energy-coupling factor transporter transmembrane component T n=1 Tax=Brevibacillus sp. SYSU BS000544 TaxID=3416443 RepID=UPI003CE58508